MQNVPQRSSKESANVENVNVNHHDIGNSPSTPNSSNNSSPDTDTYSERRRFMSDSSESEEDSVSEVESFAIDAEFDEDPQVEAAKFLLSPDEDRAVDPETQARLEALLQAAGIGQLTTKDGKLADPEVLRRLTSSVSCALDEAAAALTRMRTDNPRTQPEKTSIVEATVDGDVRTVRKLLGEGRSVHETSEEGESLLSLACSAGYFELAQVLLAMHANVEDRGIKGECTPLMEAASAGHLDIVRLLVAHGADVNAQSNSGNTPLMYGCAGGHPDVVEFLLDHGANVEDHNENGHTPLMEAASAGYVELAKILLLRGAGINTHSNEFKESALTLACYKGHLDMVRFLLDAGADQEHKTDEMHTALMEASMDGHVEVARLLLDSGAQVNMPTDSFESPLTLAACGGHVDLAMLLIERGANIEEVNDEGYTPLMEAAREGHEEMVALLLSQGANINAQTEETQETALTLACCGGFSDVADFLIKAGADIELGASTPLMEAAQEGHLELVRFILENNGNVEATTQTGDTALTYACENGHTDVAELLLEYHSDLEHESEGGRTPLMKACRAGHLCVVQFLIGKGANVNKQTTNNDHTPLSLACASGNLPVVELLLKSGADINHKLKDNSTMLIEAAKGGHTGIVQCLLDYPHSIMNQTVMPVQATAPSNNATQSNYIQVPKVLQETVQLASTHDSFQGTCTDSVTDDQLTVVASTSLAETHLSKNLTHEAIRNMNTSEPLHLSSLLSPTPIGEESHDEVSSNGSIIDYVENQKMCMTPFVLGDVNAQRHQLLEDFQDSIERDLHEKQQFSQSTIVQPSILPSANSTVLQNVMNIGLPVTQQPALGTTSVAASTIPINNTSLQVQNTFYTGPCLQPSTIKLASPIDSSGLFPTSPATSTYYFTPLTASITTSTTSPSIKFSAGTSHIEVSQNTAISDRPKAKPISKKENKGLRKALYNPHQSQTSVPKIAVQQQQQVQFSDTTTTIPDSLNIQNLELDLDPDSLKNDFDSNMVNTSLLQFHNPSQFYPSLRVFTESAQRSGNLDIYETTLETDKDLMDKNCYPTDLMENIVDPYNADVAEQLVASQIVAQHHTQSQPYPSLDEPILSTLSIPPDMTIQTDGTPVEYYMTSPNGVPLHATIAQGVYDQYHVANKDQIYQAGFQAGMSVVQQKLVTCSETFTTLASSACSASNQYFSAVQPQCVSVQSHIGHLGSTNPLLGQARYSQHNTLPSVHQQQQSPAITVQAATQTSQTAPMSSDKKQVKSTTLQESTKVKKVRASAKNQLQQQSTICQQNQPQSFQIDANSAIAQYNSNNQAVSQQALNAVVPPGPCLIDLDTETESNHDTALTLACAGGHDDLVELLIKRGADIEHRDKKGFTPLILAATAGHEKVVEALLNHGADIEAQSERTKDTPLSLACSGGRFEVVELLLTRGANKEHRNVSDYTPLSLAASGGYVNIIKLLLSHGAEINSRTGSKLGISPLMLAAMNGHTTAVKLLLDNGSDINAQIETNRNTALTLACFQGRHEVVSLLLERKANVEHRAKTGLTPLMEAASGGYVEVGKVLIAKGADVNATPVPSSRDTALTIAADKGHCRFVDLLLKKGAAVEVKNKKGNSPLWLAANGGHLSVVELLYSLNADIDSEDNRKVSCLMAAFRKGHVKVVKWMVNHVMQFPSDQDMNRYVTSLTEKEILEKCNECIKIIKNAKEAQALKANQNASILLEQIDQEKNREEIKRQAAARKRERKKRKKMEKIEEKRRLNEENKKNETYNETEEAIKNVEEDIEKFEDEDNTPETNTVDSPLNTETVDKEEGDSGIDANSQGSCSSNDVKPVEKRKEKKKKKPNVNNSNKKLEVEYSRDSRLSTATNSKATSSFEVKETVERRIEKNIDNKNSRQAQNNKKTSSLVFESSRHPAERDDFESTGNENHTISKNKKSQNQSEDSASKSSPKQSGKRAEEDWKEVEGKKSRATSGSEVSLCRKVSVPNNAISRVIGRAGSNINAIRAATGAHIEVDKQQKGQADRCITIKGAKEMTAAATNLIQTLIKDPEIDAMQLVNKSKNSPIASSTLWDKTLANANKKATNKTQNTTQTTTSTVTTTTVTQQQKILPILASSSATTTRPTAIVKPRGANPAIGNRGSAPPRLMAQAERNTTGVQLASNTQSTMSYTTAIMASARGTAKTANVGNTSTFAAKVTDTVPTATAQPTMMLLPQKKSQLNQAIPTSGISPMELQANQMSPHKQRTPHGTSGPMMHYHSAPQGKFPPFTNSSSTCSGSDISGVVRPGHSSSPVSQLQSNLISTVSSHIEPSVSQQQVSSSTTQEYSLFSSMTWKQEESQKLTNFASVTGGAPSQSSTTKYVDTDRPVQVDASKAPGYRGTSMSSPVSSKTSSNCTTPPNLPINASAYSSYPDQSSQLTPLTMMHKHMNSTQPDISSGTYYGTELTPQFLPSEANMYRHPSGYQDIGIGPMVLSSNDMQQPPMITPFPSNSLQQRNYPSQQLPQSASIASRLNPKAPDFSTHSMSSKQTAPIYNTAYPMPMSAANANLHMVKPGMVNYRAPPPSSGWTNLMQQKNELSIDMTNIANIVDNINDIHGVHTSSTISPLISPACVNPYSENRKVPPQPIGTERTIRKSQTQNVENWVDTKQHQHLPNQWAMPPPERYSQHTMRDQDFTSHPVENYSHHRMSHENNPYMGSQQYAYGVPQTAPVRPQGDYSMQSDQLKMELSHWDNTTSRGTINELHDKQPGWSNKWSQ